MIRVLAPSVKCDGQVLRAQFDLPMRMLTLRKRPNTGPPLGVESVPNLG
jgi:hypothetical protein